MRDQALRRFRPTKGFESFPHKLIHVDRDQGGIIYTGIYKKVTTFTQSTADSPRIAALTLNGHFQEAAELHLHGTVHCRKSTIFCACCLEP